jgi:hypothetical protein
VALVGAVLGGVLAAVLLALFYRVALFLIGAAAGFGIGMGFCAVTGTEPGLGLFIVCAVAGGLASLALERLVVTVLSSLVGAAVVAAGALHFLRYGPTFEQLQATGGDAAKLRALVGAPVYIAMGGAVLLGVLSMLVQFKVTGKKRPEAGEASEGEAEKEA